GVHKDDGEGQGTQEVDFLLAENPQGNNTIHLLRLTESQSHKGYLVLVGHHLYQTGQGREAYIVPVWADDPPVCHPNDQVSFMLCRLSLARRYIAQDVGRLKNPGPHLR